MESGVQLEGVSDPMNTAMYIKSILGSLQRGTRAVRLVTVCPKEACLRNDLIEGL